MEADGEKEGEHVKEFLCIFVRTHTYSEREREGGGGKKENQRIVCTIRNTYIVVDLLKFILCDHSP